MLRSRNLVRFFALMLLVVALTAVGLVNAQDKKVITSGRNMGSGDIPSLDPGLATDSNSIQVIDELFLGATMIDQVSLETAPGLAESWTISEDGLVTTFKLMKEVPWVRYNADSGAVEEVKDEAGNVRYVTAQDFVYGMTRTLDPATAGGYALTLAGWIKGGAEFNAGTGKAEDLGLKAIDDNTLEITAPTKAVVSLSIYGLWMSRAVPQWAIEEFGDKWTEPENINSYGPFALKEWVHEQSLTLVKNPFWVGTKNHPQSKIDEVFFKFLDAPEQLKEYEAGTMDVIEPPVSELDRLKADATLSKELSFASRQCTYYYAYNIEKPPFDNVHIRRAFSMAIDRQSIIDNILKGGQSPAGYFSYPGLLAAPHQEDYPGTGIKSDPEGAKAELAAGLKELGMTVDQLPQITLLYNTSAAHKAIAEAAQQMWVDTLGINVQLTSQDFAVYLQTRVDDPPQITRAAWCSDYPDTHNFLSDVFRVKGGNNNTRWENPEFTKLIDEAVQLTDTKARTDLYAQAEDILINKDAAIAPVYFYVNIQLTKPNIERFISGIGTERYETWDIKSS